jgi:hypothetical protein
MFLALLWPWSAALFLFAQEAPHQGKQSPLVTDAITGRPVPYASLGIKGKPIGTVADANGRFALHQLAPTTASDTVIISCVGYQARKVLVTELSGLAGVTLQPRVQALQEVRVRAAGWKQHTIGRDGTKGITFYNFHLSTDKEPAQKLGREVGPCVLRGQ